jgi:L,D-transpeptidase YnhG
MGAIAAFQNIVPLDWVREKSGGAQAVAVPHSPTEGHLPEGGGVSELSPLDGETGNVVTSATQLLSTTTLDANNAETRLIAVYALIEQGDFHAALTKVQALAQDHPNFQLAQLVHGDMLRLRYQPDAGLSDYSHAQLQSLRAESRKRLFALRNRPPMGTIPHQFLALAPTSRHAIAIDAAHSRLYLFENQAPSVQEANATPTLKLVADYFISVGKSGVDKRTEGDGRTPLGNYYITSTKDGKLLPSFYGAGALALNYPNAFDNLNGRTGSGIWLHGTPPNQFVRAPLASDGCIVVSNPDMEKLLAIVSPRTTPVVIAEQLQWVDAQALTAQYKAFESVLIQWQAARSTLSTQELANTFGEPVTLYLGTDTVVSMDLTVEPHIKLGVTNLSLLQSSMPEAKMVVTFDETEDGRVNGVTRRQYWVRQSERWQLVQDTVISGQTAPDQVKKSIQTWARAWSQKNITAYLNAYDTSFAPPSSQSRKAWAKERTSQFERKALEPVTLSNVLVKVNGNQAVVTFLHSYQSDQLMVSDRKTLQLVKRANEWRIAKERVGL